MLLTKPSSRICTKCKVEKPFTDFDVCKSKGFKWGIYPSCKECKTSYKKNHILLNRFQYLKSRSIYSKNYYKKNRDKVLRDTSAYVKAHPEMRRKVQLKHIYGISVEYYKTLEVSQDGKCAICNTKPNGHVLFVDHCHKTNKVRGLLCRKCNSLLGFCNDGVEILNSAIRYIEEKK